MSHLNIVADIASVVLFCSTARVVTVENVQHARLSMHSTTWLGMHRSIRFSH